MTDRYSRRRRRRTARASCYSRTPGTNTFSDPQEGHLELGPHLETVLAAVGAPDHREPDERSGRERFYKKDAGPSRWLMVVVELGEEPARIVTALGYGHGRSPIGWMP